MLTKLGASSETYNIGRCEKLEVISFFSNVGYAPTFTVTLVCSHQSQEKGLLLGTHKSVILFLFHHVPR